MTEIGDKKKEKRKISKIMYYNCDKKEYYANKYPET